MANIAILTFKRCTAFLGKISTTARLDRSPAYPIIKIGIGPFAVFQRSL